MLCILLAYRYTNYAELPALAAGYVYSKTLNAKRLVLFDHADCWALQIEFVLENRRDVLASVQATDEFAHKENS
ncbi:hypothetical protein GCM10023186_46300 [Hymenobacter koreensis]|uniref:Uncharacterized protein n=1 Tax=Hymenobacter koreensis TaxID=1084523 RepID=A0ABP8JPM4_9BACT